jgi:uncharacterized damage-inducible protein DinB
MALSEFLTTPYAYAPPSHILEDLSEAEAHRRVDGSAHTIAELVAHLAFWQAWFLARCRGHAAPMAEHASEGWPAAPPGSWPGTHAGFLAGVKDAAALAADPERTADRLAPAIEFPPLAHYTVGDALTHVAIHNAHHLGQVVTLRQQLGCWPPPAGSWTW